MENSTIAIISLGITVVSFVLEKIPLAVTSMAAALAMGIFKVMPLAAVSAGCGATVTMMVAGMMIVGDSLFATGVARVIGIKLAQSRLASSERTFTFVVMILSGILTGFLANSAVIAMFMPIIAAVAARSDGKIFAKHITMMVGMMSTVGATISMVGSTTQLVAQGILVKYPGARPIGFLEMAPITIVLVLVLSVYAATIGLNIARKHFDFPEPAVPGLDNSVVDQDTKFTWRMWMSSLVMILCIIGFVMEIWNVGIIALTGATVLLATKCIDFKQTMRNLDVNTLVILSAAQAFGAGLSISGGDKVIANFVLQLFGGAASPIVMLTVAIVLGTVLTQWVSNTAVAAMMVPIFLPVAAALNASPVTFTIAIIIASSMSITTPVGTPCVAQTLPVGYRYNDYVKVGTPICIVMMILTCILMPVIYGF